MVPHSMLLVTGLVLLLGAVFLAVHAVVRMRTGTRAYRPVLWWALSAVPIAAVAVAYQSHLEVGSGLWWLAFATTVAAGTAWGLYGVLRAMPVLRGRGR